MADNSVNTSNNKKDGDNKITKQFAGLPLGTLICQPVIEAAKGQMALCRVYLQTLFELAFENPNEKEDTKRKTRVIKFTFDRLIIDKTTGQEKVKTMTLNAPVISLVPLPAFTMDELSVDFEMEVKETKIDQDTTHEGFASKAAFNYWGFEAEVTGNISADSSHTRSTDNSAKYSIHARAIQQPPSEGMAKLTALFAESMEPIEKTNSN